MAHKLAGVWIDRYHAVIVRLDGRVSDVQVLLSGLSSASVRPVGDRARPGRGRGEVTRERDDQQLREQRLRRYFGNVASRLAGFDGVVVFGPGLAKHHFARAAARREVPIAGVYTAGPMSDERLVDEARRFFRSRDEPSQGGVAL